MVDSGRITHEPAAAPSFADDSLASEAFSRAEWSASRARALDDGASVRTDQGYLAMGASLSADLDLADSQLEPMSNSVLNGLLDKQLDEVYMQLLTDNLARCDSRLGHSMLRGLVPPPQPSAGPEGPDSLEPSVAQSGRTISYLHTHNLGPCSSNFSSPVLRISEPDPPQPQRLGRTGDSDAVMPP